MEKKSNLSNVKSNMENIKSNGPSADDLKRRFKEGSIPLQTDYADLINIADIGRRAVGKAPGQTDNPNSALKLGNDGALAVKLNDNGGLKTDNDGLSVKIKNKSLSVDNSGLAINAGRGLRINNDKLEVGNYHGIEIVNEGVKVKAGNGIKVDNNGVSIDTNKVLPTGMIVMFSGDIAPTGWAFCDGSNGTPDLRSRFVMCSETISETGKSSNKASGGGNRKNFSISTEPTQVSVTVNVQETTLTVAQIPKHDHIGGMPYCLNNAIRYEKFADQTTGDAIYNSSDNDKVMMKTGYRIYPHTSPTGGGEGHNHQATASSPSHEHSVDVIPPYYLLAFIMKL
ncbi:hypothetical protein C6H64_01130 [Photorhabdus luminescens]|nr:hypothetical protein C6H64_01130 [Photorhabdus luminescens]